MAHTVVGRGRQAGTEALHGRLTTLDGLRGLAALIVVVHHSLLTWQVLAAQYFSANRASGSWWLVFTPLHLVWAGTEAVMVFFVLSGLVLALPFLQRPSSVARWRAYYCQRLIRLYVPVIASLALAAVLVTVFPRVPGATTSWWFDSHAVSVDARTLAEDAVLLRGVSWINPSLWSLQYEVLFSLFLPVYILVSRRLGDRAAWLVPPLLALAGTGTYVGSQVLSWLPVFGIGVVMAASRTGLQRLGGRITGLRASGLAWSVISGVALVLLLAEWWSRGLGEVTLVPMAIARALGVAGAALVCFLAMVCPGVGALCSWRPVRWLGTMSFSLYLVHEPILVSVSSLVGGSLRGVAVTLTAAITLSLLVAAAFHRLVELPSQRLARSVGRRLQGASGRSVAAQAPVAAHRPAPSLVGRPHSSRPPAGRPAQTGPRHPPLTRPIPVPRTAPPAVLAGRTGGAARKG